MIAKQLLNKTEIGARDACRIAPQIKCGQWYEFPSLEFDTHWRNKLLQHYTERIIALAVSHVALTKPFRFWDFEEIIKISGYKMTLRAKFLRMELLFQVQFKIEKL